MTTFHTDTSEWQNPIDDTYPRKMVMFRALNENGGVDEKFDANLAWALKARTAGEIDNFGFYVIPCIVSNALILAKLDEIGVPRDCVIMIDMESWSGRVQGDHSHELFALTVALLLRQGGRVDLPWGYGNLYDIAAIWASRPAWLGFHIAKYDSPTMTAPGVNVNGWQYATGPGDNRTDWPSTTPPFGACDHNALFVPIPPATPPAAPTTPEAEVAVHIKFGMKGGIGSCNADLGDGQVFLSPTDLTAWEQGVTRAGDKVIVVAFTQAQASKIVNQK